MSNNSFENGSEMKRKGSRRTDKNQEQTAEDSSARYSIRQRLIHEDYYTDEEVAAFMLITKGSLAKKRCAGRGHPPYKKIGRQILYPKKEFHAWLNSQPVRKAIA